MTPSGVDDTTRPPNALEASTSARFPNESYSDRGDPSARRRGSTGLGQGGGQRYGSNQRVPKQADNGKGDAPRSTSGPPRRPRPSEVAPARFALVIGALLLASVALALVMLSTASGGSRSPQGATPAPDSVQPQAASSPAVSSGASAPAPVPTTRPSEPALRATVTVLEPNYTVQPGDTLGQIARNSGTTVEALRALNRLEDGAVLRIGLRLIVPQD